MLSSPTENNSCHSGAGRAGFSEVLRCQTRTTLRSAHGAALPWAHSGWPCGEMLEDSGRGCPRAERGRAGQGCSSSLSLPHTAPSQPVPGTAAPAAPQPGSSWEQHTPSHQMLQHALVPVLLPAQETQGPGKRLSLHASPSLRGHRCRSDPAGPGHGSIAPGRGNRRHLREGAENNP